MGACNRNWLWIFFPYFLSYPSINKSIDWQSVCILKWPYDFSSHEMKLSFIIHKMTSGLLSIVMFLTWQICFVYEGNWILWMMWVCSWDLENIYRRFFINFFKNLKLLLAHAGKDISWAFNEENFPLFRVNQYGRSLPVFPPVNEKESIDSDYWWNDERNLIGQITCIERRVRIINTLTRKSQALSVCDEDTIRTIKEKYKRKFNSNADNYTWRKTYSSDMSNCGTFQMDKTLTQNGLLYHENEKLGLAPAIWLFYNPSCWKSKEKNFIVEWFQVISLWNVVFFLLLCFPTLTGCVPLWKQLNDLRNFFSLRFLF